MICSALIIFDIRDNSLLAAVVKHLLCLLNPADVGAREAFVPKDERARVDGGRGSRAGRQTEHYHCAIAAQESIQLVEISISRGPGLHRAISRGSSGALAARTPYAGIFIDMDIELTGRGVMPSAGHFGETTLLM